MKFTFGEKILQGDVVTARLGAGTGSANHVTDAEVGKFVKFVGDSRYNLCAAGDPIEGRIAAVEKATLDDYTIGSVAKRGGSTMRFDVVLDGLQATPGTGAIAVDLRSNGSRAGTLATLSLKGGTFNWGGGPHAVTNLNVDGVLQGESLTVSRISGDVASGGVVGSFSATARAEVPVLELSAITGELTVDSARFTFSGIPVEQQRPSRVEFARGALAVADIAWSVANNPLVIGGSIGFAQKDPPLDLSVQGLVDLRVLSAFISTLAFDGDANLNTLITGTVSRP